MLFTEQQLKLACQLKDSNLIWEPRTGQYVYDSQKYLRQGSPFQPHVYYLHDLSCFVDHVGSFDELSKWLVWLPTFEESRELLKLSPDVTRKIEEAVLNSEELNLLYKMLISQYSPPCPTHD